MSEEINNLRVTKLRAFLVGVITEINDELKSLNVNYLSSDVDNYSLDKIPTASEVEPWIMGIKIYRDVYNLRSRMGYSADEISNIENIGFYEKFEEAIKIKNKQKDLPLIEGIESIYCLNCGTQTMADTNTCEFDIQIQIEYRG